LYIFTIINFVFMLFVTVQWSYTYIKIIVIDNSNALDSSVEFCSVFALVNCLYHKNDQLSDIEAFVADRLTI